jgi:hypothetical protein
MPLCRILYNAPYIVTPEAAIKADMIWSDFLKESQHNQAEITLPLNKQKKHLCIDCNVADVL